MGWNTTECDAGGQVPAKCAACLLSSRTRQATSIHQLKLKLVFLCHNALAGHLRLDIVEQVKGGYKLEDATPLNSWTNNSYLGPAWRLLKVI